MSAKVDLSVVVSFPDVGVGGREFDRLRFFIFLDARFGRTRVVVLDDINGPHRAWKRAALPRTRGDGPRRDLGTAGSGVGGIAVVIAVCAQCAGFEARLATLKRGATGGCTVWKEEGLCLVEGGRVGFLHWRF